MNVAGAPVDEPIDRNGWGPGPWDGEPDHVKWRTLAGFPAQARRTRFGYWCGYVAVPHSHPSYGRVPYWHPSGDRGAPLQKLDVHGGVTAVGHFIGDESSWWIGFDCGHALDSRPGELAFLKTVDPTIVWPSAPWAIYRDLPFVRRQCEQLAQQLHELLS